MHKIRTLCTVLQNIPGSTKHIELPLVQSQPYSALDIILLLTTNYDKACPSLRTEQLYSKKPITGKQ